MTHQGLVCRTTLARPPAGGSTRHHCGRLELILEATRGGFVLVVHDGSEGRRWPLGLRGAGDLQLVLRVPCYPLIVALRETLILTPGARLRGYLQVPLVPTVVWHHGGVDEKVCELLSATLATEWDEQHGYLQRCVSPWLHRPVPAGDATVALMPVVVRNDTAALQAVAELPVSLSDDELRPLRGHLVVRARRANCTDAGLRCGPRAEVPA